METRGAFLCRSCGHRAEVEIDESADALVDPEARQDPVTALGLTPCPACGKRDRSIVLRAALAPAAIGAALAVVLSFSFVAAGMVAGAGPDPQTNDARFPWILGGSGVLGIACGVGLAAVMLRGALRTAAAKVLFVHKPAGDAPYRAPADVPPNPFLERPPPLLDPGQRSAVALNLTIISAVVIGLLRLGGSLPVMLALGAAFGAAAGAIRGADRRERLVYAASFAIAEACIVFTTSTYAEGRSHLWSFELLIPLLIGAAPGALVYVVATRLLSRRDARGEG